jgi:hypothetical protein
MRDQALAVRTPDPAQLPQPGWRLIGFASIGLGTGLYSAEVPVLVLALALVPAVIAMVVIAARATVAEPLQSARIDQPTSSRAGGERHG